MIVPAEILDHILSFLQSDPAALRVCSESHPLLFQLAEPHLYSRILLKADDRTDETLRPSDLAKLLSERPHIAHYIHSLHILVDRYTQYLQNHLEEISNILPKLLSLRLIVLGHHFDSLEFNSQPEIFRLAFLACLCLPSMRDVTLTNVLNFPFNSLLNDEYKSLRRLTLRAENSRTMLCVNKVPDGPAHPDRRLPFESLCLRDFDGKSLGQAINLVATGVLRPRSLKFYSSAYNLLPNLLAGCSTTLTNLFLDFPLAVSCHYDFDSAPPSMKKPLFAPAIASSLPYLEELTIHSKLDYACKPFRWGFYSAIPTMTKLFSTNHSPSARLKHFTLSFDCACYPFLPVFPPRLSVLDVFCIPLVNLLSTISASSSGGSDSLPSFQVHFIFDGVLLAGKSPKFPGNNTFRNFLLASLSDCEELIPFTRRNVCKT